jgi:archaellum component FlaC
MPDKLTDSEIVKALDEAELFLRNRVMDGMSLKLNEYDIGTLRNISQLCAKAYDEINRLQAENEDIKFLYENLKEEHLEIIKAIKHTKTEAYKECIEKVKENSNKREWVCSGALVQRDCTIPEKTLDNLLKELERKEGTTYDD